MAGRTGNPEVDDVLRRSESVSAHLATMQTILAARGESRLVAMLDTAGALNFAVRLVLKEKG